jgi:purine-binding chemotaxis protein CheW
MNEKQRPIAMETLRQSDSALTNYLDTLLAEIDSVDKPAVTQQTAKEPPQKADTLPESKLSNEATLSGAQRAEEDEKAAVSEPQWAQNPFQILRFHINGVNLVVPLISLHGIIPLDRPVTHLPGQPEWNLGVVTNHGSKVVVVDTRRLLMPEGGFKEATYSHLLLIGDGNRGLVVEGLGDMTIIEKEAIRWRSDAAQHPWYGGILIEELSILLDVEGVMDMLAA